MGTQTAPTRLDRIVDGSECIQDTLTVLRALGSLENFSHPESQKDRWLSERLDRAFTKEPERSDLPSIMEVASSKGLQYVARVYEGPLNAPDIFMLKTHSSIMPSFLSQPLRAWFWTTFAESLAKSKDRLLALPPSQGQTLSNQELLASIFEDTRGKMLVGPLIFLTDQEDDYSEDGSSE